MAENAEKTEETRVRGAGGTPGGVGQFLAGFVMTVAGGIGLAVRSLQAR